MKQISLKTLMVILTYFQNFLKSIWYAPLLFAFNKVRKKAKSRKRYNQVPHLTQDTTWESNKNTIKITNKSQNVSPFPAGDHKAAMNRRESMRNTRHKNTNDHSKNILLVSRRQTHPWFWCGPGLIFSPRGPNNYIKEPRHVISNHVVFWQM